VHQGSLLRGHSKSCGCLRKEVAREAALQRGGGSAHPSFKHGHASRSGAKSPEYYSWYAMNQRCANKHNAEWKNYGGRGIKVCDRWLGEDGFVHFLKDLGPRPEGTTLDRIDPNGNYEPSNCRYATPSVQSHNRRKRDGKSTRFRGVSKNSRGSFTAAIEVDRKKKFLGRFDSEIEAAHAYNEAAKQLYGDFANLNQILREAA
jgi:hypothetical protein